MIYDYVSRTENTAGYAKRLRHVRLICRVNTKKWTERFRVLFFRNDPRSAVWIMSIFISGAKRGSKERTRALPSASLDTYPSNLFLTLDRIFRVICIVNRVERLLNEKRRRYDKQAQGYRSLPERRSRRLTRFLLLSKEKLAV